MFCQIGFESLCQFAPREHDSPSAPFTFQADVRAEACYRPFVGATGMLFAEAQVVVEVEVGEHGREEVSRNW